MNEKTRSCKIFVILEKDVENPNEILKEIRNIKGVAVALFADRGDMDQTIMDE